MKTASKSLCVLETGSPNQEEPGRFCLRNSTQRSASSRLACALSRDSGLGPVGGQVWGQGSDLEGWLSITLPGKTCLQK